MEKDRRYFFSGHPPKLLRLRKIESQRGLDELSAHSRDFLPERRLEIREKSRPFLQLPLRLVNRENSREVTHQGLGSRNLVPTCDWPTGREQSVFALDDLPLKHVGNHVAERLLDLGAELLLEQEGEICFG